MPRLPIAWLGPLLVLLAACHGDKQATNAAAPVPAGVMQVSLRDVPVVFEFVGQTQSSQQVEIRARVNGFLERRIYKEGAMVHAGEVMFRMDRKPFEAALDAARAEFSQQKARLGTAQANLNRVRPLAAKNALSQRDLDDAVGQEQAAAAALEQARANVTSAELNLSYTDISSPVEGLSSFAKKQDGSYIDSANSLLTYVARVDPMWVNFSLSENELLQLRSQTNDGTLKMPPRGALDVEIVLADGSRFPQTGHIAFADAALDANTGTYLIRAVFDNPERVLRPGQFVRVRLHGALRAKAIAVPQQAVMQGDRGAFVWTVDKDGKAQQRVVEAGEWTGKDWTIRSGLHVGDQVVVDNIIRMSPGATLKTHVVAVPPPVATKSTAAQASSVAGKAPSHAIAANSPFAPNEMPAQLMVMFDLGSDQLTRDAVTALAPLATKWRSQPGAYIEVTGYTDASGAHKANEKLAAARAKAVRAALMVAGVPEDHIRMQPPVDIIAGATSDARRVEVKVNAGDAARPAGDAQ